MMQMTRWSWLALGLALCAPTAGHGQPATASSWIWYPERPAVEGSGQTRYLRRVVQVEGPLAEARLHVMGDDGVAFWVNGALPPKPVVDRCDSLYDLSEVLHPGENVLAFAVSNSIGAGGLLVNGTLRDAAGKVTRIFSDASFRTSRTADPGWDRPGFDDSAWPAARAVGNVFAQPWYGHTAFNLEPYIEPEDRAICDEWLTALTQYPRSLDTAPADRATLTQVDGKPVLTVNGEAWPPYTYRGTVDPLTDHGRRQIALFRDAGVHVYTAYLHLAGMWRGPGDYDFTRLDQTIRGYLSVDPDARLMLILHLIPPDWWMDQHPEEMVAYAAGDDFNSSDESYRVRRPSLASEPWRHDMQDLWQRAIRHLEGTPWGKRVIAYHPGYGIYTEWHYYGSWSGQMPDTGVAMTGHFRRWLRQRYGSDQALQAAWRMPEVTLDTAQVPGMEPRLVSDALGMRDPQKRRWVMDYYLCQQQITADAMDDFCRTANEATGGRTFAGAFYGYYQGVFPQTQGGHLELGRMLKSPEMTYFTAPYDYSNRLMGQDGRLRCLPEAFQIAGKVHMVEADTRTHLHPVEEYGKLYSEDQSVAAIRREFSTALTTGSALWWCDFGDDGSGGWYDHPRLIGEVGEMVQLARRRLSEPRREVAQVAVVCDLPSNYVLSDGEGMGAHFGLIEYVTRELHHTGAPFDMLLLPQLSEADLARYKLVIMLDTLVMDAATRAKVAEATRGKSVLWMWAPGISDGERLSADLTRETTGFGVRLADPAPQVAGVRCESDDALVQRLPVSETVRFTAQSASPVPEAQDPSAWFNPRDERFMREHYSAFAWNADQEGLRWRFRTADGWTDLHLAADLTGAQGLQMELRGSGGTVRAELSVAVKDAVGNEYCAPPLTVSGEPQTLAFAFEGLPAASWRTQQKAPLELPVTGFKVIVRGVADSDCALEVTGVAALRGETEATRRHGFTNPAGPRGCLTIEDPAATVLGVDPASGLAVLAARGQAPARQVLCTVPYAPRELLSALMDEAGVLRYVDDPEVVVRADSRLLALHTARGGAQTVRLPGPMRVTDAVTGAAVGEGSEVRVELAPDSTMLLRTEPLE